MSEHVPQMDSAGATANAATGVWLFSVIMHYFSTNHWMESWTLVLGFCSAILACTSWAIKIYGQVKQQRDRQ